MYLSHKIIKIFLSTILLIFSYNISVKKIKKNNLLKKNL
jgi:hypothetical protein